MRRRWFPKVTVTVLEPVKLAVADELKGRWRRQAAGAALYEIMSDLVFRTTSTDRTVFDAVIEAAEVHGWKRVAVEDPVTGSLSYKRLLLGAAVLGRKLMPLASEGKALGVMLPNANGAVVTILGVMSAGRVPAMINFTAGAANILAACKAAEVTTIVTSRAFIEKGKLDAVGGAARAGGEHRLPRGRARDRRPPATSCAACSATSAAGRAQAGRSGGDPVHLGLGRHAEGRRALPPQHAGELPRRRRRASTSAAATRCSTCCRCSTRSG